MFVVAVSRITIITFAESMCYTSSVRRVVPTDFLTKTGRASYVSVAAARFIIIIMFLYIYIYTERERETDRERERAIDIYIYIYI